MVLILIVNKIGILEKIEQTDSGSDGEMERKKDKSGAIRNYNWRSHRNWANLMFNFNQF